MKKAVLDGRILSAVVEVGPGGSIKAIDWRLADELWARNTDPAEALKNGKTPDAPSGDQVVVPLLPIEATAVTGPKPAGDAFGYQAARADRERYEAKRAELDYLERLGLLTSSEEVRREIFEMWRDLRDKLMRQVAAPLAPKLAVETDPMRIEQMINERLRAVCGEFSDSVGVEPAGGTAERAAPGS